MIVVYMGKECGFVGLRHGSKVRVVSSPWRSGGKLSVQVKGDDRITTVLVDDLDDESQRRLNSMYLGNVGNGGL